MSTESDILHNGLTEVVERVFQTWKAEKERDGGHDAGGESGEPDEIDRMLGLIEAASAKVKAVDPDAVEAVFATQAAALDVIFGQFARAAGRKFYVFDSMRVALRAQAQSRATYRSLIELKTPRLRSSLQPSPGAPSENSSEQTIESTKSPS
jgi:hypothetical protein